MFIDPKTGEMRAPTPEEKAALRAIFERQLGKPASREPAQVAPVVKADGTIVMEVDPSLMSYSVVRVQPDGSLRFDCVGNEIQALELVASAPQPAAGKE